MDQTERECPPAQAPRASAERPRYLFQVDSDSDGSVIRVIERSSGAVFREVPVEEFLAFARHHTDMRAFFFGNAR